MIHFRQLPIICAINVFVLVRQLVSFHGRFGINDGGVNGKDEDDETQNGRYAWVRFHVKFSKHDDLINETKFLWISDSRWFRMELLHLERQDITALLLLFTVTAVHSISLFFFSNN